MKSEDKLNEVLDSWRPAHRKDGRLADKVWEGIADSQLNGNRDKPGRFAEWWGELVQRPVYAIGMAAAFILCGFFGGNIVPYLLEKQDSESVDTVYRLSIDPLMRLESDQGVQAVTASLRAPATLRWLQEELDLDSVQFERVVLLHSLYESEFEKLFGELSEAKTQFQEMEERRFKDDVIDFFSVNQLKKHQNDLRKTSNKLRSELHMKLSEVMAPEQWERYQSLVKPEATTASQDSTDV